jgi:RNA polymerase sigma-70 factor, ECF subfamily
MLPLASPAPVVRPRPDVASRAWVDALNSDGAQRDAAIERLHALLLRAAHFELARRHRAFGGRPADRDDLAMQAADDALMAILKKLDSFRGESRFTTWAFKFAVLEAGVKARRKAWEGRELPLDADGWNQLPQSGRLPDGQAQTAELLASLRDAIANVLTDHQREVFTAIALNDVPIDVLAERRGTTRGALYKTVHDARRKLRVQLAKEGLASNPVAKPATATNASSNSTAMDE